ncbi:hypothetical protein AVEN_137779-1 [Araneus ventricosus]|uniref:Tc1-like transposase DDE domain-containing protein n=1 Tax=Araneus ventricosus TaxID=182803 RepID=A0A4Y2M941_ARAVE|nr:hypothetical protein AVEN_137779-1 [Araneus ventricosus]
MKLIHKHIKVSSQVNLYQMLNFLLENWKYQQDNAPIHSSNSTNNWLQVKNVETLKWPAKSPDLNPIKNLWCDLARRVYANQWETFYIINRAEIYYRRRMV